MNHILVQNAERFPNACACGNITGPFADRGTEIVVGGMAQGSHVYVCKNCAAEIAEVFGHTHAEVRKELDAEIDALSVRVLELGVLLEAAENNKTISLSDFREYLTALEAPAEKVA